VRVLVSFPKQF
jgi:hypothetical protein